MSKANIIFISLNIHEVGKCFKKYSNFTIPLIK